MELWWILLWAVLLPAQGSLPRTTTQAASDVYLQGFGWQSWEGRGGEPWWIVLRENIPAIQAAGFTHVWLPPPSRSVAQQGYMPAQLYNLNSSYGSHEQLLELNRALLDANISPVADIVINHRCADEKDEQGMWRIFRDDVAHPGRRIDWGKWAITHDDPVFFGEGGMDTGDDFYPAPDLDHANSEVREGLVDWMGWLHTSLGFQGWRFDFAKGYAPAFIKEYMERTLGSKGFCVGENWVNLKWDDSYLDYNQDDAISTLRAWAQQAQHCALFDFATKGIVQEAIKNTEYDRLRGAASRGPGLMGAWPEVAVTFVDNHDTGSTQQLWPWPSEHVMLGYVYLLTHPGTPTVFWEHFFDWGLQPQISELIALRRRNGIGATSTIEIQAAQKDLYVARVKDRVLVKLGPRMDMGPLTPDKLEWELQASGLDWAIWERRAALS